MKKLTVLALLCAGVCFRLQAAEQEFDFKDPKSVNNIRFSTDAPLESINGTATGISGKATYDPANPATLKGKIVLDVKSLTVPNAMMGQHLQSAMWMDSGKFPEITFEISSAANAKTTDNVTTADVTGTMTIRGVSKTMTIPVSLTYMKDKLQDRLPTLKGDLLVVRSKFPVKRSDFGINKGQMEDKVSDEIKLELSVAGQSPR